jgi:hypothetical protein
VLDIETDSTIQPDENAEKQKRVEFMQALSPLLQQGVQAMQLAPQLGKIVAESIRFVTNGFRPGRQMDEAIDELAEEFANYQPPPQPSQGEDPEAAKMMAEAEVTKANATAQTATAKAEEAGAKVETMRAEMGMKTQEAALENQKTGVEIEKLRAEILKIQEETQARRVEGTMTAQSAQVDMALKARGEQRTEQQFKQDSTFRQREVGRADKESAAKVAAMKQRKANG